MARVSIETPPAPSALALEVRAIHRLLKLRIREQGIGQEWTPSQIAVLAHIEQQGAATVSGLARAEAMRPQSMREIVASLQSAGLLQGSPDPEDGRQTLLSLTPRCIEWIREGRAASHDWLSETIAGALTPDEQRQLGDGLALLRRVVAA